MEVISECALGVAKVEWRPRHGSFVLTVVCKATFELRPDVSPLAAAQDPVVEADVYTGEGGALSLASELVPFKRRPEVLVAGHAYAPEGRPVTSLVARLVAGEIDKTLLVVGDRYYGRDGLLGEPAPFTAMPLVWERAAGGPGTPNPAGRPSGSAARALVSGRVPAPNVMPVGLQSVSLGDVVPPVGFGPIAPAWPSRVACLHRHAAWWDPSRWHERPLPDDIDLGYFNAAPPDQQRVQPFGEEVIYLENMHPRFARLSTRLAPVAPVVLVDHGAELQRLAPRCDTLVIDTDRGLAMLVWRAHVLLERPDRSGRLIVRGPSASEAALSVRASEATPSARAPGAVLSVRPPEMAPAAHTPDTMPSAGAPSSLPSARPSARASSARPSVPAPSVPAPSARTSEAAPSVPAPSARPSVPAPSVPAPSVPAPSARPPEAAPSVPAPSPRAPDMLDVEGTLAPGTVLFSSVVLPFSGAADPVPGSVPPPSPAVQAAPASASIPTEHSMRPGVGAIPPAVVENPLERTHEAGLVPASPMLPFAPAQEQRASRSDTPPQGSTSGLPFVPPPSQGEGVEAAAARAEPGASPWSEPPAPPPLLGASAMATAGPVESPTTGRPPAAQASAEDAPGEDAGAASEIAFDAYPPERCGAIAARLACDERSTEAILRAEALDEARWQRVHAYWLDRIHNEAARSRKRLLSAYDTAYVSALEAERGPVATDDYARLAEAAERSAVAGALAERGLPASAWPHIHRVWIWRMVSDVRLGQQVRKAIEALQTCE